MARLVADENFPLPVVVELRKLGYDVITIQEMGKGGQAIPDEEVLELARFDGRALLTLNRRHFIRLHNIQPKHSGIIVCTFDPDFINQANRIHIAIQAQNNLSDQLLRVNRLS